MIWILLLSLLNDKPQEQNQQIENPFDDYYESDGEIDSNADTSSDDITSQVSDLVGQFTYDYLYNLGQQSVWISQHLIKYRNDNQIHYCENNICFFCDDEYNSLDSMTRFYNDGRLEILHQYENSTNEVDIEENVFFETLDDWSIYNVKYSKNSYNEQTVELTMKYRDSNYAHLKILCFKPIENTTVVNCHFIEN